MATSSKATVESVAIKPPNFQTAVFRIVGTAPYVQNNFSQKAKDIMHETQVAGSTQRGKKGKTSKDFDEAYEGAKHYSTDGWVGMPASAFRKALISACKTVGFVMTLARLSVFVEADGFDRDDGTPLIRFIKGEPHYVEHRVKVGMDKADLRARPMWDAGWEAEIRITFDGDQFTLSDISNLLMRVGMQVGVGEGRPDSPKSAGMGWGTFRIKEGD